MTSQDFPHGNARPHPRGLPVGAALMTELDIHIIWFEFASLEQSSPLEQMSPVKTQNIPIFKHSYAEQHSQTKIKPI